jgi:hypothetical protein
MASDLEGKRAQLATCQAACDASQYPVCELVGDLASDLNVGRNTDSARVYPLSRWSQACKGAKIDSACKKCEAAIAKLRDACSKPGAPLDVCLDYDDAIGWGEWNAEKKNEQEDLAERLCFTPPPGSAVACSRFGGLAYAMEEALRKRAVKAFEHGCALGDGQQCCVLAMGYDSPQPTIRDDPKEANRWSKAAVKAGYKDCENDRAAKRRAMQPPIIY